MQKRQVLCTLYNNFVIYRVISITCAKMTVEAVCSRLEKHHATKFNKFDKHNGYRLNSKNFTVN